MLFATPAVNGDFGPSYCSTAAPANCTRGTQIAMVNCANPNNITDLPAYMSPAVSPASPVILQNRAELASSWSSFIAGTWYNPPSALGESFTFWSGCGYSATEYTSSEPYVNCNLWTTGSDNYLGNLGSSSYSGTEFFYIGNAGCGDHYSVLCACASPI